MKYTLVFCALMVALGGLSACKTTIDPKNEKVIIHTQDQSGDFCPPGQAKKGNC